MLVELLGRDDALSYNAYQVKDKYEPQRHKAHKEKQEKGTFLLRLLRKHFKTVV